MPSRKTIAILAASIIVPFVGVYFLRNASNFIKVGFGILVLVGMIILKPVIGFALRIVGIIV